MLATYRFYKETGTNNKFKNDLFSSNKTLLKGTSPRFDHRESEKVILKFLKNNTQKKLSNHILEAPSKEHINLTKTNTRS